ncbi:hypothetical protein PS6_011683, partial [Mucor atramentarius]
GANSITDGAAGTRKSTVSIPSSSLVVAEPPSGGMHNLVQDGTQQSTSLNLGSLPDDTSTVNSSFSSNVNVPEDNYLSIAKFASSTVSLLTID